ncbi:MAG TPA: hypothetical protein VGE85_03915 [Terracidiphilus sp.]|jgi:hypothetical protein
MQQFIAKFKDQIEGSLCGFDRLVLSGTLRRLSHARGMDTYLCLNHVALKDFGKHAERTTQKLKEAVLKRVEGLGRPTRHLPSSRTNKEEVARQIASKDGIGSGLICALTCVEPCWTFRTEYNPGTGRLELRRKPRQCLFVYQYGIHPEFGFYNARIQTWFPFPIQICLNGREWLARQMDQEGLAYRKVGNCFTWLADYQRAQELMNAQARFDWVPALNGLAAELHPIQEEVFGEYQASYYWGCHQSEWASDLVFRDGQQLQRLYPLLIRHAMTSFGAGEVMRFLSKRVNRQGQPRKDFHGELDSDLRTRAEGARIKHRINGNSIKLYDKGYDGERAVLRPEVTMNYPNEFRVYRPKEGGPEDEKQWLPLRKCIADLARRAEVCQKANERYLDAFAQVDATATLAELTRSIQRPTQWGGRRVRALRPLEEDDSWLLEAVNRGEFVISGFRNRDLRNLLYPQPARSRQEEARRSASMSRKLRLLRAHRLIHKIPRTHRYQVNPEFRVVITTVLAARKASLHLFNQLLAQAA